MFKTKIAKVLGGIVASLMVFGLMSFSAYADASMFDLNNSSLGIVKINYQAPNNKPVKIMIQNGDQVAYYSYGKVNQFPLVFGSGNYTIGIFENISGNDYQSVDMIEKNIVITNDFNSFSEKSEMVYWTQAQELAQTAKRLTSQSGSNQEKALLIYQYLVKIMSYDNDKAASVTEAYDVNAQSIFEGQKGICLDFSVLYASMLRSVGVPTKVVKGYKTDIESYHAWNEVYNEMTKNWMTIDITYDLAFVQHNVKTNFEKASTDYKVCSVY